GGGLGYGVRVFGKTWRRWARCPSRAVLRQPARSHRGAGRALRSAHDVQPARIRRGRRADELWSKPAGLLSPGRHLRRPRSQRRKPRRPPGHAAYQIRSHHQSDDRQVARPHCARQAARARRRGDRMKRRAFIALIGGAAAWPLVARAQQDERMRRIGVLISLNAEDPQSKARAAAFLRGLHSFGWADGRNLRIDYRWGGGDAGHMRRYAAELIALVPDVVVAGGSEATAAFRQASRDVPIVFVNVGDPVGAGFVDNLSRPSG